MLKKSSYLFSLFIVFSLSLEGKSLLYEVSSKISTVYILGSIHLAKPELYPLDKEIIKAYESSEVLVLELDPSSTESIQTIEDSIIRLGRYPLGKRLDTELTSKTYKRLKEYLSKTNVSLDVMKQLRPWVVMLQLSMIEMTRLGYSAELGIDQYFLQRAKEENKTVLELESAQAQMSLLAKDDKAFQDKLLFYTLESMDEMEPMLNDMFINWRKGNAEAFDKIMSKPLEDDPSLEGIYDDIITKRNYAMTKRIEGFLETKKDYFVVVGSGHVVGKEGIVSLLKGRGHKVIQH